MLSSFKCLVCGYIHVGETPPQNCPICDAPKEDFEGQQEVLPEKKAFNSWRCLNCEYIHEGNETPDICIVCGASKEMFQPVMEVQNSQSVMNKMHIVIVGGGIAGLSCAEELRKHSDQVEITIISADSELPYYRLNLTRYLVGEIDRESLTINPSSFYPSSRISLRLNQTVTGINRGEKEVELSDGSQLSYDKLVLTSGSHPFIPPIPGNDLSNVVTVRKVEDADFLLEAMNKTKDCLCIGGGILGMETAAAMAKQGVKVTLLEGSEWLMPRQLNQKAAVVMKEFLGGIGVGVIENVKVKEIYGGEKCEGVLTQSGSQLAGDLVILAAGVRPNTSIARKAGLEVNNGLIVDNHMRTSDEHIYAAGDITEHYGMVYGLWNIAQFQGKIAAQNVLNMKAQFGGIPRSNVVKVVGIDLFSIGEFNPVDGSYDVFEKEIPGGYILIVLRDGKITGSIVIGDKPLSIKVKGAVEKELHFPSELYKNVDQIIEQLLKE